MARTAGSRPNGSRGKLVPAKKQCVLRAATAAAAASVVATLGFPQGSEAFVAGGGAAVAAGSSRTFLGTTGGAGEAITGLGRGAGAAVKRASPTMTASVKVQYSGHNSALSGPPRFMRFFFFLLLITSFVSLFMFLRKVAYSFKSYPYFFCFCRA